MFPDCMHISSARNLADDGWSIRMIFVLTTTQLSDANRIPLFPQNTTNFGQDIRHIFPLLERWLKVAFLRCEACGSIIRPRLL